MTFIKKLFRFFIYLVLAIILIIIVRALESRAMPNLNPWHRIAADKELLIINKYDNIDSYLIDEDTYIRDLFAKVAD